MQPPVCTVPAQSTQASAALEGSRENCMSRTAQQAPPCAECLPACMRCRARGLGLRRPGAEHPGAPARPERHHARRPAPPGHEPLCCRRGPPGGQQLFLRSVAAMHPSVPQAKFPGERTAAEPLLQASGQPLSDAWVADMHCLLHQCVDG